MNVGQLFIFTTGLNLWTVPSKILCVVRNTCFSSSGNTMFCLKYLVLPITNRHLFFESLSSCSRPPFVPAVQCFKTDPISESGSAINRWPCHSLTDLHTFENTKENCDHHNYHFNHHYLHRYFSVIRAKHCFWLTSKKKRTKLPDLGRGGLLIWAMLERIKVTGDSTHKFCDVLLLPLSPLYPSHIAPLNCNPFWNNQLVCKASLHLY